MKDLASERRGVERRILRDRQPSEAGKEDVARSGANLTRHEIFDLEVPESVGAGEAGFFDCRAVDNVVEVEFVADLVQVFAGERESVLPGTRGNISRQHTLFDQGLTRPVAFDAVGRVELASE